MENPSAWRRSDINKYSVEPKRYSTGGWRELQVRPRESDQWRCDEAKQVLPRPMEGWRRNHEAQVNEWRPCSLSPPYPDLGFPDTSLQLDQLASKLLSISETDGPATSTPRELSLSPERSMVSQRIRNKSSQQDISKDEGVHCSHNSLDDSESGEDGNPRFKTEICRNFKEKGCCLYGDDCQFAHGTTEMRDSGKHNKYKTKLCQKYWIAGYCAYGPRCNFLHNEDDHASKGRKPSGGETSGDSLDWTTSPSSLSPSGARVPPLSSLTRPPFGSGRLAVYQNDDQFTWVDTWTQRVV